MKNLNGNAPMNEKFIRVNQVPFMIKALKKAIMKRLENRNQQILNNFRKQKKLTTSYIRMKLFKKSCKNFQN